MATSSSGFPSTTFDEAGPRVERGPASWRLARRLGLGLLLAVATFVVVSPGLAGAKVFASQNQALREAFPDATRIARDSRLVLRKELAELQTLTGQEKLPRVIVLYTAWRDEELLGFAHIDVHNVRTKPEAFLVVLKPDGTVRSVRVIAFHEPLDYLPTERWYGQFEGRSREDRLRVGGDVHGVVGATLSTRAAADGVRRMLAYWQVLLVPLHGEDGAAAAGLATADGESDVPLAADSKEEDA